MNRSQDGREESVSRALVTLADTLVDEYDVIDLLDQLAGFCVELLSADAAGIVLGDARRELRAVAASDEAARVMELLQLQSDEGPCLDCFQTAAPVSVADLTEAAGRWPTFVAAVAAARGLPLGPRAAAAAAGSGDRCVEPVRQHARSASRAGPRPRPGAGGRGDDRHPAGAGDPAERGTERAVAVRAEQSRDHRAGQGRPRPVRRPVPGRSFRAAYAASPAAAISRSATWHGGSSRKNSTSSRSSHQEMCGRAGFAEAVDRQRIRRARRCDVPGVPMIRDTTADGSVTSHTRPERSCEVRVRQGDGTIT